MQRSGLQKPLSSATLRKIKRVFGFTPSQLQSSAFQKAETRRSRQQRWHRSSPSSTNFKSRIRHTEATRILRNTRLGFSRSPRRALMRNLRLRLHCRTQYFHTHFQRNYTCIQRGCINLIKKKHQC